MFEMKLNIWSMILALILTTSTVNLVFNQSTDQLEPTHSFEGNQSEVFGDKNDSIDDYEYEDNDELEDNELTIVDRWKIVYEQGKNVPIKKSVKNAKEVSESLKTFEQNIEFILKPSKNKREISKAMEFLYEIDLGISNDCQASIIRLLMAAKNREVWALKFFDSTGRPFPTGSLEGVYSDLGEYTECLNIVSPEQEDRPTTKGRYCLMNIIIPLPPSESYNRSEPMVEAQPLTSFMKSYGLETMATFRRMIEVLSVLDTTLYRMGICIPSQCSAQEFEALLNTLMFPITRMPVEVGPQCHEKDERKPLDNFQIISITCFAISIGLIILSTGSEIYIKHKVKQMTFKGINEKRVETSDGNHLLTSFSIIRNTRLLFKKNTKFAALDTLRLLFIMAVHMLHHVLFTQTMGILGLKKIFSDVFYKTHEHPAYIFLRTPLMIEALFTLSGFLLSFTILGKLDKTRGRFNYLEFIFQRWIRFFVLLFGALLFFYVFPLTGDGPLWDNGVSYITPSCQNPKQLLKMLFFVQNSIDNGDIKSLCNPPAWFLSSLLQLTLIGPVFVVLYHRKKFFGIIALISVIMLSLFASIAPHILSHITPYTIIWEYDGLIFSSFLSFMWWYMTPNNHATVFFIGIGFGYLMRKNIQISRLKSALFWILSIVVIPLVYIWYNTFWYLDHSASLTSVLLWSSIGKLMFSLAFGWIYFACCTGRGGYFNEILSWHGFQPIARLSFGIYILHYLVFMHRISTIHYTYVFTDKYMLEHFVIDFMYDVILAYFFYLLIESPFFNVFNHFMGPKVISVEKSIPDSDLNKIDNNILIVSKKSLNGL